MPRNSKLRLVSGARGLPPGKSATESSSQSPVPSPNESSDVLNIGKWGAAGNGGGPNVGLRSIPPGGRDELWNARQVAKEVGIPAKAVYSLGIPCVKVSSRRYRWWLSDIMTHFANRGNIA
jgi:hypothetical protein